MILQGNQRGGGKNLALHLMKEENDHVEVHELHGFVADDLIGAFNEAYAISRGTKAKQYLFSLSLNPPPTENVPTEVFEDAIARVEQALGLANQPRAVVFHEKNGRRHAHAVWSRIDTDSMKAVQLSFTKRKLMNLSREIFLEQGWKLPKGLVRGELADPNNVTLAQWQQANRLKKDPAQIKRTLHDCWAASDSRGAFAAALKERGYILAKGDRRGFVAVDLFGGVFPVSRWTNQRGRAVKAKLGTLDGLPTVEDAKSQVAGILSARFDAEFDKTDVRLRDRSAEIKERLLRLRQEHQLARAKLRRAQEERLVAETKRRHQRFRRGALGLWDRITGKYARLKKQFEAEAYEAARKDQAERDQVIFDQLVARRRLINRAIRLQILRKRRNLQRGQSLAEISRALSSRDGLRRSNALER